MSRNQNRPERTFADLLDTSDTWWVREATADDEAAIRDLAREVFDPGYDLAFAEWLPGSDIYEFNRAWVAQAAGGDVIGVGLASVAGAGWMQERLHATDEQAEAWFTGRDGLFVFAGVAPEWQGRGVATSLYRYRLEWLRSMDAGRAFGMSWRRPNHVDSSALFEKFDFSLLDVKVDYYRDTGRTCPDCGTPCECHGAVYARDLP